MEHIALDLGGRESQICIPDDQGTIVEDRPPGIGNDYVVARSGRLLVCFTFESRTTAEP
jgi:hypothetical protein